MSLDIAITNTPVWTGDRSNPWTDAVGIRGEQIVGMGPDVADQIGTETRVFDRAGMALPGFQDAHVHPPFAGRNLLNVDLDGVEGRERILSTIQDWADAHPEADWIIGGGWAMEYFPGGTPSKDDLDAIVPDRPVFLLNRDVHGAWINSEAMRRGGLKADTPDPFDGRYERLPHSRELQGTLHEGAAYRFQDEVVPAPTQDQWEQYILAAQRHLHSLGVTGWQDAWVTPATQAAYEALAAAGKLTARVVGALWWDRDRGLDQIDDLIDRRDSFASEQFLPTTVKIMIDGVLENQTGALLEPYCGCGNERGLTYVPQETLIPAVKALVDHNFQIHMHAIGDRAVRMALDALTQAKHRPELRHTIAHVQVVDPSDIARFEQLEVVVNCQTYWAQSEPQMDELTIPFLGESRSTQQYPFETLRRSGARLAMGSDWGVTTANPLEQIEVAVRRVDPENRRNEPFLPHESLSLQHALEAFTAGSAYLNHDDNAGVLAVGRRADLVLLDSNLFDEQFAADVNVRATIAGGRTVFEN